MMPTGANSPFAVATTIAGSHVNQTSQPKRDRCSIRFRMAGTLQIAQTTMRLSSTCAAAPCAATTTHAGGQGSVEQPEQSPTRTCTTRTGERRPAASTA